MAGAAMALRGCVVVLVLLAAVPSSYGQCNTTLLGALMTTPQLQQLAAVVTASGLANTLNTTDNVTLFAPTNTAFNGTNGLLSTLSSMNLTLANVTSSGNNRAASILLYHIVPMLANSSQLTNGEILPTKLGTMYNLTVSKIATTIKIIGGASNATVVTPDIKVCNSVVHIIDNVLLPASLGSIPVYNSTSPGSPGSPPGSTPGSTPGSPPGPSGAAQLGSTAWVIGLAAAVSTAMLM